MKKSIIVASLPILFFAMSTNAQSYTFNSDLYIGSSGQDVSNLQSWLMSNGYDIPAISSGAASTGYFGSQTQSAVQAYQRSIGLPAYGFFGPLTRSYWSNHFGNGGNPGGNPGNSLRVISPNGGETWAIGTTQYITWINGPVSAGYNQTGDIKLEFFTPACAQQGANPQCMVAVRAPVTIASGVNLNSGSYAWNVGQLSAGQYKVQICPTNMTSSSQCDDSDNYFNITSSGVSNGQTPVISGIDAPISLSVNQTGTWTVHATDPLNGTLSYSVNWGDAVYPVAAYSTNAALPYSQSTTFTHSYSSAGTYTITFTVQNSSGLQAQTTTAVVVGNSNTSGSLRIISPNGGEVWARGTNQSITWTSLYYSNGMTADLKLVPYQAPCPAGSMCPMYMLAPYTIATNIPINQNSYSWNVGTALNYSNISQTIPDGQYTVQICQSGTSNCDSSDSTFTITSSQTSNLPDINIISPNGGEVWRAGITQTVTVNVIGDPTKVANSSVALFLENSSGNGNLSNGYSLGGGSINGTTGMKSFQVILPTNYIGQNKIYATLNFAPAAGNCQIGYSCVPTPVLQAYDYSDNYFTVTN